MRKQRLKKSTSKHVTYPLINEYDIGLTEDEDDGKPRTMSSLLSQQQKLRENNPLPPGRRDYSPIGLQILSMIFLYKKPRFLKKRLCKRHLLQQPNMARYRRKSIWLYKSDKPKRLVVYPKDVMRMMGGSLRQAQRKLKRVRDTYEIPQRMPVTVEEFCRFYRLREERVQEHLY